MAFGGSFGKLFGITTPEAARIGASFATGGILSGIGTTISSLGNQAGPTSGNIIDVSAPPAGVDSPATVSPVSQTSATDFSSRLQNQGLALGMPRTPQAPVQAGFGLAAPLMQAGRLLSRPSVGGALTGLGAGFAVDTITDMFGRPKKFVITRKLQREVKKVFMMSGGDIGFVAANSMMLFGRDLNEDQILMVLFKTFKNQGPFVTKAAVRKTRSTIRKMETLCDLKDRLCPPKRAPARRRMPAKSTTITNVR
jgi:hypothetical protein